MFYFNFNILNFYKLNLYKNILNFYKLNLYSPLLFSYQFKYSWVETKSKYDRFYFNTLGNYYFVEFFQNLNFNNILFDKYYHIDTVIKHKNKFGFFKKINSIKNIYLSKYNFFKTLNINHNFNINTSSFTVSYKNFDFVERKLFFFKNNRKMLKNIFKKTKKREYFMSKFLKKISKVNSLNFLNMFEFSIVNILLNSGFFLNKNDIFFFLKNNFICVNNKIVKKTDHQILKGDIVTIYYNKYYYFLYRKYLNSLNTNINKYGNFFKKNNTFDLKNDFNFVNKLILIKNDVPNYIEVDYISMSLILLYKNVYNYNCTDLKLLNVFLKRLNN